jgi:hypothetical protein
MDRIDMVRSVLVMARNCWADNFVFTAMMVAIPKRGPAAVVYDI